LLQAGVPVRGSAPVRREVALPGGLVARPAGEDQHVGQIVGVVHRFQHLARVALVHDQNHPSRQTPLDVTQHLAHRIHFIGVSLPTKISLFKTCSSKSLRNNNDHYLCEFWIKICEKVLSIKTARFLI